jgi:hypothetical protein
MTSRRDAIHEGQEDSGYNRELDKALKVSDLSCDLFERVEAELDVLDPDDWTPRHWEVFYASRGETERDDDGLPIAD